MYTKYSFFLFLLLGMVVLPIDSRGKESAAPSEVKIFSEPFTGMEFVRILGGCFEMGCGSWTKYCNPDESPLHEVCVETVWVGKTEVTQGQWQKITGENPAHFRDGDDYPVEMVSWDDLQGFIGKLGKKTGLKSAAITGEGKIKGKKVVFAVTDRLGSRRNMRYMA